MIDSSNAEDETKQEEASWPEKDSYQKERQPTQEAG